MVANVQTMFSTKETPWHREGVILSEYPSRAEAIQAAGLGWKVEKRPIFFPATMSDGREVSQPVAKTFALVRTDSQVALGLVGKDYKPFQNEECFSLCEALSATGSIKWETAGALGEGERVWCLAKVEGGFKVGEGDEIEPFALVVNAHDKSLGIRIVPTPIRVVCQNTLALALDHAFKRSAGRDGAKGRAKFISLRHTGNLDEKIAEARLAMSRVVREVEMVAENGQSLARRAITAAQVKAFASALLVLPVAPNPEEERFLQDHAAFDRARARYEKARDKVLIARGSVADLMDDPTNRTQAAAGTWWGVYNSATAYADHVSDLGCTVRSLAFGWAGGFKERALALANELAFA